MQFIVIIKLIPWIKNNNIVFVSDSVFALFWCLNQRSAVFFFVFFFGGVFL